MILVNHYAIRPPIPKTNVIKHCRVEIMAFPFFLFHRDRLFNFYCLFRQRFSCAYLLKLVLLPQRVHTTLFIQFDKSELTCWCLCSLHAGVQMSPDEVVGSRDCCRHSIAELTEVLLMCLYIFSSKFSMLAPRCSSALLHNLQSTSDRLMILASNLATGMIPAITIISRLLCLQGTGCSNASLRTLCFNFAAT